MLRIGWQHPDSRKRGRFVSWRTVMGYEYPYCMAKRSKGQAGRFLHLTQGDMEYAVEVGEVGRPWERYEKEEIVGAISDEEAQRRMEEWIAKHPDWADEEWQAKYPPRIIPEPYAKKPVSLLKCILDVQQEGSVSALPGEKLPEGRVVPCVGLSKRDAEALAKRIPGRSFVSGRKYEMDSGKRHRRPSPVRPSRVTQPTTPPVLLLERTED